MDWIIASAQLIAGLFLLLIAGDWLISSAVNLGTRWKLSPIFMGTTVVAAGTSLPELVVAVIAQLEGSTGLTLGNVIGSNIFNIGVVLGLIFIWKDQRGPLGGRAETSLLGIVTLAFLGFVFFSQNSEGVALLSIQHGVPFLLGLVTLLYLNYLRGRKQGASGDLAEFLSEEALSKSYFKLLLGMIGLWLGADLLVNGASEIAILFGISETVVGLTVVAAGTGAPELFASIAALRKNSTGIALGNILGSNIFNTLGIIGAATLIGPLPLKIELLKIDLWVMGAMTVSLLLIVWFVRGRWPLRIYGGILLATYLWWLLRMVF